MKNKKENYEGRNIININTHDKEKEKIENFTLEIEMIKIIDNKKDFNEKEDKQWIKIIEEELEKFSLWRFEEDFEKEKKKSSSIKIIQKKKLF